MGFHHASNLVTIRAAGYSVKSLVDATREYQWGLQLKTSENPDSFLEGLSSDAMNNQIFFLPPCVQRIVLCHFDWDDWNFAETRGADGLLAWLSFVKQHSRLESLVLMPSRARRPTPAEAWEGLDANPDIQLVDADYRDCFDEWEPDVKL